MQVVLRFAEETMDLPKSNVIMLGSKDQG